MEKDISELLETVSLTDRELRTTALPSPKAANPRDKGFYLVGKVLNSRRINPEAFARTMQVAFHCAHPMEIKALGGNKFIFRFHQMVDMNRILTAAPWHYENRLLVLGKVEENQGPDDVKLDQCPFFVQVHKLPFLSFPLEVPNLIGELLGEFIDADLSPEGLSKDASLRLRVAIDITQPLIRVVKLTIGDNQVITAPVQYEKLPLYCEQCGLLDHLTKDCVAVPPLCMAQASKAPYGSWLRGAAPRILGGALFRQARKASDHNSTEEKTGAGSDNNIGGPQRIQQIPVEGIMAKEGVALEILSPVEPTEYISRGSAVPIHPQEHIMMEVPVTYGSINEGNSPSPRRIRDAKNFSTVKRVQLEGRSPNASPKGKEKVVTITSLPMDIHSTPSRKRMRIDNNHSMDIDDDRICVQPQLKSMKVSEPSSSQQVTVPAEAAMQPRHSL
ncbi:hypothetical protein M569_12786 [Genlisea aurea]|uniref:DUF4283 domain-containing protein n=1 Tax=Genlisea aurea TaxID=192259 RepID=S8DGS1_9LAMI|nr:hypothetical protein M569_12786 [Genlisea aurea]